MGERRGDGADLQWSVLGRHRGLAGRARPWRLHERAPTERAGGRHRRGARLRDVS